MHIFLTILLSFSSFFAYASDDEFSYTVEDGYARIVKYTGNGTVVNVPEYIGGYPVKVIGEGAFRFNTSVTEIYIPVGVERIETRAFDYCTKLSKAEIPDGVTFFGEFVFNSCIALQSVTLPDSIDTMGNCTFFGCTALKNASLPSALKKVPVSTFSGCKALESVMIPEGYTSVEAGALNKDGIFNSVDSNLLSRKVAGM